MPFKIVRNDLTKMQVDVIVNTANQQPTYSSGTDTAVYKAAGEEELLAERKKIGSMNEGEVAITPGFKLPAKYIIHAVGPRWTDGNHGEPMLLYGAYKNSLELAKENHIHSLGFPLISSGIFGYPKDGAWRQAIHACVDFMNENPDYEIHIIFAILDDRIIALGEKILAEIGGKNI